MFSTFINANEKCNKKFFFSQHDLYWKFVSWNLNRIYFFTNKQQSVTHTQIYTIKHRRIKKIKGSLIVNIDWCYITYQDQILDILLSKEVFQVSKTCYSTKLKRNSLSDMTKTHPSKPDFHGSSAASLVDPTSVMKFMGGLLSIATV